MSTPPRRPSPWPGVAWILAGGIALGLGWNALARALAPGSGLPWIAIERRLPSLEASSADSARAALPDSPAAAPRVPRTSPAPAPAGHGSPATRQDSSRMIGARVPHESRLPIGAMPPSHPPGRRNPAPEPPPGTPPAGSTANPGSAAPGTPAQPQRPSPEDLAPPPVPDSDQPIQVQLQGFKRFFDAGAAVIVDAREAAEYAAGHVAGALSIPAEDASAHPERIAPLKRAGRPIIVYCSGPGCDLSTQLATLLLSEGIRKVLVFEGGFPAWQAAGYPVERGAAK